jgi:hypothetical protein
VLAWELHLTNARPDTVTVRRVAVNDGNGRVVTTLDTGDLARWMQPLTRGPSATPATVMGPGVRRVLHLWIAAGAAVPAQLKHQVTVATSTAVLVVDGAPTARVSTPPLVLSPPLRGGPWAALYDPALPGGHRMAIYTVEGRVRIPGRFAMDFVRLPSSGTFDGASRAPDRNGFGSDVLAVGSGTIVAAVDDMPDNVDAPDVPRARFPMEAGSGNYVVLDLGRGQYAFYEHLAARSIRVRVGDRVRAGDVIARLGYSGSSSIGPHLHFHVANANSLLGAEGLPYTFIAFRELGAFADIGAFVAGRRYEEARDPTGVGRAREMPRPNAVVMFP